nr:MAG TPA: hypothetical protein [Bacteriophage sp.]
MKIYEIEIVNTLKEIYAEIKRTNDLLEQLIKKDNDNKE